MKEDIADLDMTLPQVAIKFALQQEGVSTVIPGIRNVWQAKANIESSYLPDLPADIIEKLHKHNWRKAFWNFG